MKADTTESDAYPSEQELSEVKNMDCFELGGFKMVEYLLNIFWMPDWCITVKRKYAGKSTVYISTGGWSGNEEIMWELKRNYSFWRFWREHKAGGHYKFIIY